MLSAPLFVRLLLLAVQVLLSLDVEKPELHAQKSFVSVTENSL